MSAVPETPSTKNVESVLPTWTDPVLEGYETRPEVTAYALESGPWNAR